MTVTIGRRAIFGATIVACAAVLAGGNAVSAQNAGKTGYVYTINNDAQRNGVVVFQRDGEGTLTEVAGSPFATGGKGLALPGAGDDIDEQGAIRFHGKHVLAVNPGSNSISVFERKAGGALALVPGAPFPSGGDTPLSLAVHGDLVYVANQAPVFARPAGLPNITGFRIDPQGRLTPIAGSTVRFPAGFGPAQVEFNAKGDCLAVTSGFQDASTSQVHTYKVQSGGTLSEGPGSPINTAPISGTVGFSWDPIRDRLYVSNFRGSAITVFDVNAGDAGLKYLGTPYASREGASCWTAISGDGKWLYVANFVSNSISTYAVHPNGHLELKGSVKRRGGSSPDTKDLAISSDGKWLYAISSTDRKINIFKIGAGGQPAEVSTYQSPAPVSSGQHITGLVAD